MTHLANAFESPSTLREVGGYRVVRVLSASATALTLVAHADGDTVAVRMPRRDTPDAAIDSEVAISDAVKNAGGPLADHLSLITDLATLDDGRVALFSVHQAGPRLDSVLHSHAGLLSLGEAVTVLVPIATAIENAHQLGITGLPLTADSVRFSADGAPILTRRHRARLGPALPDRFRDHEPAYAADFRALETLGSDIVEATLESQRPALRAALAQRGPALLHALFDLAEPLPLQFDRHAQSTSEPLIVSEPHIVTEASAVVAGGDRGPATAQPTTPAPVLPQRLEAVVSAVEALGVPHDVSTLVRRSVERLARGVSEARDSMTRRLPSSMHSVRPRFLLVGAAAAAAIVLAIVVLAQSKASVGDHAEVAAGASETKSADVAADAPRATVVASGLPETELHPDPELWEPLVSELVDRWFTCVTMSERADAGCVASVAHAGSAAERLILAPDPRHAALRQWQQAGGTVVVTERMGAAVLVDLITSHTTAASLLVVRSEAGWRVRDVMA